MKEFKSENEKLATENKKLQENYENLKSITQSAEQLEFIELKEKIADDKNTVDLLSKKVTALDEQLKTSQEELDHKKKQIIDLDEDIAVQDYGLYVPKYDFASSFTYKEKLKENRKTQKKMVREKTAVSYSTEWTVNGSKAQGRKMTNGNIKVILRCFNSECEAAINKVTYRNITSVERKINSSFTQLNKSFNTNKISIKETYLNLKLQELYMAYEYERKRQEEKEALREQREREREEKALQKEITKKRKKIDKELKHIENVVNELEDRLTGASDNEKVAIQNQIDELNNNVLKFEDEQKELDYRIENIGAGYVYIISNIGAFGEKVFKIGVTRRLEPIDRIKELSSASVPFKFDIHAMVFSYQAYDLEKQLH